jgi:hypothetical protein
MGNSTSTNNNSNQLNNSEMNLESEKQQKKNELDDKTKYYKKYLKYKKKYINLKLGGGDLTEDEIINIYAKIGLYISLSKQLREAKDDSEKNELIQINDELTDKCEELKKEHDELTKQLEDVKDDTEKNELIKQLEDVTKQLEDITNEQEDIKKQIEKVSDKVKNNESVINELTNKLKDIKDMEDNEELKDMKRTIKEYYENDMKKITTLYGFNIFLNNLFRSNDIEKKSRELNEMFKLVEDGTLDDKLTDEILEKYMEKSITILENCTKNPFIKNKKELHNFVSDLLEVINLLKK